MKRSKNTKSHHLISLFHISPSPHTAGQGAAFARNRVIEQSHGEYICCLDADDMMSTQNQYIPDAPQIGLRIEIQLQIAKENPEALIGSNFIRYPEDATHRYTNWCNRLTSEDLYLQRFREVTIVQPTWFANRKVFDKVGLYDDSEPLLPEDLIFFHKHLSSGGKIIKVPEVEKEFSLKFH